MARVLIIEDDQGIRDILADVLSGEGYAVQTAQNGLEGLERARSERPDLIVLDLAMPTMNGWQFRAEQRRDPALAWIPVVVISAERLTRDDVPTGVAAFLPKPFELSTFLEILRRVPAGAAGARAASADRDPRGAQHRSSSRAASGVEGLIAVAAVHP